MSKMFLKVRVPPDIPEELLLDTKKQLEDVLEGYHQGHDSYVILSSSKSNGVDYDYDLELLEGEGIEILRGVDNE